MLNVAGIPSSNLTGKVLFQSVYFISLNAAYFGVNFSQLERLFFGFSLVCFTYRRLEIRSMSDLLRVKHSENLHGPGMLKLL